MHIHTCTPKYIHKYTYIYEYMYICIDTNTYLYMRFCDKMRPTFPHKRPIHIDMKFLGVLQLVS